MPVCSACVSDVPKADFTKAQLGKKTARRA
jgi:hypothetical protein